MSSNMRKLIFGILLIAVVYLGWQFMIKPANRNLAKKKQQLQEKLDRLEQFEKNVSTNKDLTKQLEELESAVGYFEGKLPPSVEIDKVLQDVTVIAQKKGLNSKMFQTLKRENSNGYMDQPLKMELDGDFNSFYSFLLELEKLPRIMKMRELNLHKTNEDEGQISAQFRVSIFFQEEGKS